MDQEDNLMKVENVHGIINKNHHFLKRVLKFVVSISVLSFVVCYSSGYTLFPHSFNVCFSTMLFSFFTRNLERKFVFLVCNGILAFLAKSSCSFSSSSPSGSDLDGDAKLFRKQDGSALDDLPEDETKVSSVVEAVTAENAATTGYKEYEENNLVLAAEEEEEEEEEEEKRQGQDKEEDDVAEQQEEKMLQETEFANTGVEEAEEESETWVVEDDDGLSKQEEEELEECGYMRKETESPAVATGSEEMMSTEELNKKFEEFIRKMKEEIRIEAKSQLIAV